MLDILSHARQYIGHQETEGKNKGPNIARWKAMLGPGVEAAAGIPWCATFVAAMLMERNGIDRKKLRKQLFVRPGIAYLESCDSWLWEAQSNASPGLQIVDEPRAGDIFLLMKRGASGAYSRRDAIHIGFVTGSISGRTITTLEGNTTAGAGEDGASVNGGGVWARTRTVAPGRMIFVRLPFSLTGV